MSLSSSQSSQQKYYNHHHRHFLYHHHHHHHHHRHHHHTITIIIIIIIITIISIIIMIIISSPHPDIQWEELPSVRQRERPCDDYLLYHKRCHNLAVLLYMMTTIQQRTALTTELHDQLRFISFDIQSFHVCLNDLFEDDDEDDDSDDDEW